MRENIKTVLFSLNDPVSGLTHFVGALLSVIGLGLLIWKTTHPFNPLHLAACTVFGLGLIMLYSASTLYHWLPLAETKKVNLRKLDHIMIFVLIASTYTPFCLIAFRSSFGWTMLIGVWSIAVLGVAFKIFWIHCPRSISTLLYVSMGWIAILGIRPMLRILEPWALFWLVSGGVLYSIGAVIYACKKPNPIPRWFGFHEIFHVFVILGSFSHFWAIYKYVTA
jgi:hemolysin III